MNQDQWFDLFKEKNLLNFLSRDTAVYRIFSMNRFIEMLRESKNTLVKSEMWDDPFENFLFSAKAKNQHGQTVSLENIRNSYFGQCWSFNDESDAMWRIYAPNKDGVKVKSTVGKLYDQFFKNTQRPEFSCYFGKVEYLREDEIRELLNNPSQVRDHIFDKSGINSAQLLLVKRLAFEHEKEARIIYRTYDNKERGEQIFKYNINISVLFDEAVLDPRMDEDTVSKNENLLKENGFSGTIRHSSLYRMPCIEILIET